MFDWMSEWMNEWIIEWMNECMIEWMNKQSYEWINEIYCNDLRSDWPTFPLHSYISQTKFLPFTVMELRCVDGVVLDV